MSLFLESGRVYDEIVTPRSRLRRLAGTDPRLHATFDDAVITVTLERFDTDGGEYVVLAENRTLDIAVDGEAAGTASLVAGICEIDFAAEPGTYVVQVTSERDEVTYLEVEA